MFKPGDKVICIYNGEMYMKEEHKNIPKTSLIKDKIYIITRIHINDNYYVLVNNDQQYYYMNRFMSLKEQRKQKIQKICSSQEM